MINLENLRELATRSNNNSKASRAYVHSVVNNAMERDRLHDNSKAENKAALSAAGAISLTLGAAAAFVAAAPVAVIGATLAGAWILAGKMFADIGAMRGHRNAAEEDALNVVSKDLKSKASLWEKFMDKAPLNNFSFDQKAADVLNNAGIGWSTRAKYLERPELNGRSPRIGM